MFSFIAFVFASAGLSADLPVKVDAAQYPNLAKFVKTYRCSDSVEKLGAAADKNEFFLKDDQVERIVNAQRMKRLFEKEGLDHLDVAEKCLFKDGDLLKVASLDIKRKQHKEKLTLTEVKQLVKFVQETGFRDWIGGNIGYNQQDKLVLFDTEDNSFAIGMVHGIAGMDLPDHCKVTYILNLMQFRSQMEPEAKAWFMDRVNEAINSPEQKVKETPLPWNTRYDDGKMDFEKVKKEHQELNRKLNEEFFGE